jgi:hypothetical protein
MFRGQYCTASLMRWFDRLFCMTLSHYHHGIFGSKEFQHELHFCMVWNNDIETIFYCEHLVLCLFHGIMNQTHVGVDLYNEQSINIIIASLADQTKIGITKVVCAESQTAFAVWHWFHRNRYSCSTHLSSIYPPTPFSPFFSSSSSVNLAPPPPPDFG